MGWIIEHTSAENPETGDALVWSYSEGWTTGDDFDTFSDEEREEMELPIGGKWTRVDWSSHG